MWKGRALRGVVGVDTRMDLWRLMAHARVVIDLAPGAVIARECLESLRFGTPIVVPEGTPGAAQADAGGGLTYSGVPELLERVERLLDGPERDRLSRQGAAYANSRHGDPARFGTASGFLCSARAGMSAARAFSSTAGPSPASCNRLGG